MYANADQENFWLLLCKQDTPFYKNQKKMRVTDSDISNTQDKVQCWSEQCSLQQDPLRYSTFVDKNYESKDFRSKIFNFLPW